MIGIDRIAGSALIWRVAVEPSMIGSWISIKIRSGRCFAIAASASSPFSASVISFGRSKHIADDLAIIRLVLDHQNALAHAASTCRSTMTGTVNAKVEPWPGCDSTQILPPCISMMRFEMASPKPVPPFLRVIALSACWNS